MYYGMIEKANLESRTGKAPELDRRTHLVGVSDIHGDVERDFAEAAIVHILGLAEHEGEVNARQNGKSRHPGKVNIVTGAHIKAVPATVADVFVVSHLNLTLLKEMLITTIGLQLRVGLKAHKQGGDKN